MSKVIGQLLLPVDAATVVDVTTALTRQYPRLRVDHAAAAVTFYVVDDEESVSGAWESCQREILRRSQAMVDAQPFGGSYRTA